MILDTSAIISILFGEEDACIYAKALNEAELSRISTATFIETAMVVEKYANSSGGRLFDDLLRRANFIIEPFTVEQAHIARQAFLDFGKGRHPAGLNFGDCFVYALAKSSGEPLLFKGGDFAKRILSPRCKL